MSIAFPSLFKISLFFLVWLTVWFPLALPLSILLKWRPPQPITPQQKLPLVGSLYILVPIILLGINWLEKTNFSNYGLTINQLFFSSVSKGWMIAVFSLIIAFSLQISLGWLNLTIPKQVNWSILGTNLLLGLWISITEETIFRGWMQNQLQLDYHLIIASSIASLIFAVSHLIWEIKTALPQLPGLWLMGMILTLARLVNEGNLGMAIGLHAGWIFGLATVDTLQLINYPQRVPYWLTGKPGQPLASFMGIMILLGTGIILLI